MKKELQDNPVEGNHYDDEAQRFVPCIRSELFVMDTGVRIKQGYSFRCSVCDSSGIVWEALKVCPICGEEIR